MAKTMKAGVMTGDLAAEVIEKDIPQVGPNDILVKTVRSSICGTDLTTFSSGVGNEFGHETAGNVVELGKDVKGIKEGDRVWINPMKSVASPELTCRLGGFSEYVKVPNAKYGFNLMKLPDNISWDQGSLIEPFGVGTRGKNRPGAKPGDNVVVFGAGSIGLFCVSSLVAQGIIPVVVDIALSDYKINLLNKIGAVIKPLDADTNEFLKGHFGELPKRNYGMAINVDIVVDCAGVPDIAQQFMSFGKENSRLSIVGISRNPQELILAAMMSAENVIMGSSGYNQSDIDEVIANLESGKTFVDELITHHYPLDKLDEALKMAGNRTEAIKVVIDME